VLVATVRALLRAREAEASAQRLTVLWQSTFDAIGDAVAVLDREGNFARCNAAMGRLMGQTSEVLIGQSGVPETDFGASSNLGGDVGGGVSTRSPRRQSSAGSTPMRTILFLAMTFAGHRSP